MPPISVVLCSYSHGVGNGIAHVDRDLAAGFDPSAVDIRHFVLRADWPEGKQAIIGGARHISLADAYAVLRDNLERADILHVNGAFDPVACHAAQAAGVPAVLEVMHQVEPGGLHENVSKIVCVSELVQSVQIHANTQVIHNGIDLDKFSFKPGRRDSEWIHVVQVSNRDKKQHYELAHVVQELNDPQVRAAMIGSRPPAAGIASLGVVHDMPSAYHQADIHFLIENRYALGLVFLEGLACGTLPVVSADSGLSAVMRQEKTGWVVDPAVKGQELDALRTAVATARTPEFLRMQNRGRALVEERFGQKRMLAAYQSAYRELAKRPRKKPEKPGAWMNLALFAQFYTAQAMGEALTALLAFLQDPRPIEPHFLRHPLGNSCVAFVLGSVCPVLLAGGHASLVSDLCGKFRQSRCISPHLDFLEKNMMMRRQGTR